MRKRKDFRTLFRSLVRISVPTWPRAPSGTVFLSNDVPSAMDTIFSFSTLVHSRAESLPCSGAAANLPPAENAKSTAAHVLHAPAMATALSVGEVKETHN